MKAITGVLIIGFITGVVSYYYLGEPRTEVKVVEVENVVEKVITVVKEVPTTRIVYLPQIPENIKVDIKEQYCLALNMYREAGNQSVAGMIAVGRVVMNRVSDRRFPGSPCEVIYEGPQTESWKTKGKDVPESEREYYPVRNKCQFSWYCDGKEDDVINKESVKWKIANDIAYQILVFDRWGGIVEGATHYHADYVSPAWNKTMRLVATIDNHKFYRWD
jgi:N-acetylmuramoyl-L-alanine amidase